MADLVDGGGGTRIQEFPLIEGQVGVGAADGVGSDGVFSGISFVHCLTNGGFTATFHSAGTEDVTMTAGQRFSIKDCASIDITSGTFHLA